MEFNTIFMILKYLGALITGVYGLYATLTDFFVEKHGKRQLSTKGYFGIMLLALSVVLNFSMDIVKDIRERSEHIALAEKERTEREERLAREEELLTKLSQQLDITTQVSTELGQTATVVQRNAEVTTSILDESLKRVEYFEMELFVTINPIAFKDNRGKLLLAPHLVEALERDARGIEALHVSLFEPIEGSLQRNYGLVREVLFRMWELHVDLLHGDAGPEDTLFSPLSMSIRLQMQDGLNSFVISHVSGSVGATTGVQCWLIYRIAPNRTAGFRTYEDFNGATVSFSLQADPELINLTTVRMHLGTGGQRGIFIQEEQFDEKTGGRWRGSTIVPAGHFYDVRKAKK